MACPASRHGTPCWPCGRPCRPGPRFQSPSSRASRAGDRPGLVAFADRIGPERGRADPFVPVDVLGHRRASFGRATMSGACFQYLNGRLVQTWASLTAPIVPPWTSSTARRRPFRADPWLPICVQTPCLAAISRISRASNGSVRQRLLAVDMLAGPHGQHRRQGMGVVGGRDDDGIDLACIISSNSLR